MTNPSPAHSVQEFKLVAIICIGIKVLSIVFYAAFFAWYYFAKAGDPDVLAVGICGTALFSHRTTRFLVNYGETLLECRDRKLIVPFIIVQVLTFAAYFTLLLMFFFSPAPYYFLLVAWGIGTAVSEFLANRFLDQRLARQLGLTMDQKTEAMKIGVNVLAWMSYLLLFYYFASSKYVQFPTTMACILGVALFHFFAIKPLVNKKTLLLNRQDQNEDQDAS
ncbi:hypothetical protein [Gimesia sp.]|uniref:hypothetical protein n=1 Tax=Gimesia sp. TaxID=2024833 RepID=UPI000C6BC8E0|nr:hypothetical protein [Gimesia sp.]MAX37446.1 hypothetical protein [Gimesia sp.]HAH45478.1 hypothetical protein [Planctomycetaceae bacterium]HBL45669.1 hypothetical protein [Planctomycetaceae bacterium]|tara:strand:- start:990 stop:1652 length:663 start_codon:yes stop_codon:yes gene_type:complete